MPKATAALIFNQPPKGESLMRKLLLVSIAVAGLAAASALYAQDARELAGSMMRGGMMDGGSTMGRMSRMMDHCSTMMQGGTPGDRPNDQWRKKSPVTPHKDG